MIFDERLQEKKKEMNEAKQIIVQLKGKEK